jgi:chromosome segregation ATPase
MKNKLKKLWNWILNLTTLDEKIVELAEEVETRIDRVKEEVADVVQSAKEVGNQISDVKEQLKEKNEEADPKNKSVRDLDTRNMFRIFTI